MILINPNIATVQTSKNLGRASPDRVYFLPIKAQVCRLTTSNPNPHHTLTPSSSLTPLQVVTEIIRKERPDGVIVSMGGQTALNVGVELYNLGVFEKYDCKVLGTPIDVIVATEDREIFSQKLKEINETLAVSYPALSIDEAKEVRCTS